MLTVNKSDIGKRVICGIYLESGKKYGEIVEFTDKTISVKIDPYQKIEVYFYDDVDLDFQPGELSGRSKEDAKVDSEHESEYQQVIQE